MRWFVGCLDVYVCTWTHVVSVLLVFDCYHEYCKQENLKLSTLNLGVAAVTGDVLVEVSVCFIDLSTSDRICCLFRVYLLVYLCMPDIDMYCM